jgi:hypothetical protein
MLSMGSAAFTRIEAADPVFNCLILSGVLDDISRASPFSRGGKDHVFGCGIVRVAVRVAGQSPGVGAETIGQR